MPSMPVLHFTYARTSAVGADGVTFTANWRVCGVTLRGMIGDFVDGKPLTAQ
jgi:hypothetical protein